MIWLKRLACWVFLVPLTVALAIGWVAVLFVFALIVLAAGILAGSWAKVAEWRWRRHGYQ